VIVDRSGRRLLSVLNCRWVSSLSSARRNPRRLALFSIAIQTLTSSWSAISWKIFHAVAFVDSGKRFQEYLLQIVEFVDILGLTFCSAWLAFAVPRRSG
jgi:hypothetical protein